MLNERRAWTRAGFGGDVIGGVFGRVRPSCLAGEIFLSGGGWRSGERGEVMDDVVAALDVGSNWKCMG